MEAYKFLTDGHSTLTFTPWPLPADAAPGAWLEADEVEVCRRGVHACRAEHLAHWLADSLWVIELDGDIASGGHKVAARRGRLVREVVGYPDAVKELAGVGAWRSRDRAVAALRARGHDELADALEGVRELDELAGLGERVDAGGPATEPVSAVGTVLAGLAVDAAHFALHGVAAQSPFVAACSAGNADPSSFDDGYLAERDFQSQWLIERLGLS